MSRRAGEGGVSVVPARPWLAEYVYVPYPYLYYQL
ncbi:MAG: hypothetical protein JWO38_465 [Gemmataceae bacterium]|nr:hypothetical protein [Gemmataceae bacterium]